MAALQNAAMMARAKKRRGSRVLRGLYRRESHSDGPLVSSAEFRHENTRIEQQMLVH
jgi:hypothetical protein